MTTPPALVLIDVQIGLDDAGWGKRNNPGAETRISELLALWRERGWPVMHVQHMSTSPDSPLRPGHAGNAFKPESLPLDGEPVYRKTVNSAFIGTTLESDLRKRGISQLVVAGLTTDHCVSTSVRMAGNLGFDVRVVEDATATFERTGPSGRHFSAQQMHDCALVSLNGEFATIVSTQQLLAQGTLAT